MCGIVGILTPRPAPSATPPFEAAYNAYRSLLTLQHRGQDAAGMLSYDSGAKMFAQEKDLGLVSQVFSEEKLKTLRGEMTIGHTRYPTTGGNDHIDIQPLVRGAPFGLGMVHNGNLVNYFSLAERLNSEYNRQLLTRNDLEVIMNYWDLFLLDGVKVTEDTFGFDNIIRATTQVMETVVGGYAVVGIIAEQGLVAFRDPNGIRPLAIGRRARADGHTDWCLCSESVAMQYCGFTFERDVEPGEVVFISLDGTVHSRRVLTDRRPAPCMFEWVYFSAAETQLTDSSIYGARLKLGERVGRRARALVDDGTIAPDVVMPVPDTSRTAAISVAEQLGLPYREGLIKNRYVQRSFILNTQKARQEAVELKLRPIVSEIKDRSILLVDDSIVRGTTSAQIVSLLKRNGAKEVVLAITSPPLRHSCFYGIDFPDENDLIAANRDLGEIEQSMGVKKVIYLDEEDLRVAIGRDSLCTACISNTYPTDTTEGERFSVARTGAGDVPAVVAVASAV